MNRTRRILAKCASPQRVRAYAFQSKEAPSEIQLWNIGGNPTDYGVHFWSERSVESVVARYNERGNPLLVDVEHNAARAEGEPPVTGGYARLEIREGAPWLVFDWSAYALNQIATRQRLFLSPEYDIDADTNEITKLYRVSLVADPGTYRARVLASAGVGIVTQGNPSMNPTVAAILALLDSVTDPAAAVDAVRGFVANLPGDAPADAPVDEPVIADAPEKKPDEAKEKPAFAAAEDDKDKKPVAAAAPLQPVSPATVSAPPAPIAATAATAETESVKAARTFALQSENALRDSILLRDGHRLAPSVRQWASAQSLAVVRGLCSAAPETVEAPARVTATRGEGHGTGAPVRQGLQGRDLEEMQRAMGTYKASTPSSPYTNERGEFVLPSITPTEHRKIQAAAAAKEGK